MVGVDETGDRQWGTGEDCAGDSGRSDEADAGVAGDDGADIGHALASHTSKDSVARLCVRPLPTRGSGAWWADPRNASCDAIACNLRTVSGT